MKFFSWLIIGIVLVGVIVGLWFNGVVGHQYGTTGREVSITVQKGWGVRDVGDALFRGHLISARWQWNAYVIISGRRGNIIPGTYVVPTGSSVRAIARIVAAGGVKAEEATVRIREGLTATQISGLLEEKGILPAKDFLTAVSARDSRTVIPEKTYDFLADKPSGVGLDGYLFPDTYRFFPHSSAAVVLRKFLDNFDRKVTSDIRQSVQAQGRSLYQTITLASILEAELKTPTDRAMAADIFLRRVKAGMPLNADTTILYALGKKGGSVTNADLQVDSPYNTYTHAGWPPTPINNPGLISIRAAAFPKANDYWYYLTASDGQTIYAKTFADHVANKQKYLNP